MFNPTLIHSKHVDSNNASWHWHLSAIAAYFFDKMHILLYPAEKKVEKKI